MKRAFVAMSGGVDSAVAAILTTKAGFCGTGITMINTVSCPCDGISDTVTQDAADAKGICERLGMEHITADLRAEFSDEVVKNFIDEYENCRTPNPCVMCNPLIKFGCLKEYAAEEYRKQCPNDENISEFFFATGHYARTDFDASSGRYRILKAADTARDQSYMLYRLSQKQLVNVMFPLGDMTKTEVRAIAAENGFEVANKRDSQDICFVPDGDYAGFIENYTGKSHEPGHFVEIDTGRVLGEHKGLIRYTTGQRKGLGLALPAPMYVHSKDAVNNTVTLCDNDRLFSKTLVADRVNFVSIAEPAEGERIRCLAKTRYSHKEQPAVAIIENGRLKVEFDEPQRAITPGQSVVLYDGDILLGGGIIGI